MERRRIGTSELLIGPLAFGGNVFGWTVDRKLAFTLLDAFADKGLNMIDTADIYTRWVAGAKGGESEEAIGAWMKARGNRSRIIVATKVGMEMGPRMKGLSRRWIMTAVEDSLRRLQTDYIDLYQAHIDDRETPQEETAAAFAELVAAGKVRVLGASNFSGERLEGALKTSEAAGLPRYQSLQPHYNLYERGAFESDAAAVCAERNVGVIPYYPLASGFLTGKYRSEADLAKSPRGGGMKKFMTPRGFRILDALETSARQLRSSPACVALAWLMRRPGVVAPIASATSVAQLEDLANATELKLDAAVVGALEAASAA